MLVEKIVEHKQQKIKIYPTHVNRASEMGHDCLRYLVLLRVAWDKVEPYSVELQFIFDEGSNQEQAVLRDLHDAGIEVIQQQASFWWPEYQISGHKDGSIYSEDRTRTYPLEIKSLHPFIWSKINTYQDLVESAKHWIRKYPAQLQLYMLLDNVDRAVWIFKNKSTGHLKEVWADLDYDYAEQLLKKAEQVNQYVAEKTIPPPIKYNPKICNSCKFFQNVCMQDLDVKPTELDPEDRQELGQAITTIMMGEGIAKDVQEAKARLKELSEDREKIILDLDTGLWLIEGKWIEPKGKARYWKPSFTQIQPTQGVEDGLSEVSGDAHSSV